METRSRRRGPVSARLRAFTLVELLVSVAVLSVLLAVLLHDVEAVHEAVRQANRGAHQKQAVDALQGSDSAVGAPSGAAMTTVKTAPTAADSSPPPARHTRRLRLLSV